MITILLLIACSTGSTTDVRTAPNPLDTPSTVDTDTPPDTDVLPDTGNTGSPPDTDTAPTDDTGTVPDTDVPPDTGETGDTSVVIETGDTGIASDTGEEVGPACADGTEEVSLPAAAFCEDTALVWLDTTTTSASTCGTGWHVCSASEWRAENDTCEAAFSFQGVLDEWDVTGDGTTLYSNCAVTHDAPSGGWECGSDYTGYGDYKDGTCPIDFSATEPGMASRNWISITDSHFGVMCCL